MFRNPAFRPQSRAIALEPRILFDGAAAVAVDQQTSPDSALHAPVPAAEAAPRTLVVIDTRIDNYQALASQAAPGADVVLVGAGQDGFKAIADALAAGAKAGSIQILSHGAAGQFALGSQTVSADNVATLSDTLRAWAPQLTADADILLYGCGTGAGEAGRTLVGRLAELTGADVAASADDTGAAAAGGNWVLETVAGRIETAFAGESYAGLLANADPTVTLSGAATDALLGGTFSFTATFTNASTQAGFAPFIDLILPATGKDGDDGVTFISATFLGQTVTAYVITFDAAGNATHPLALDASGAPVVVTAATYGAQAGDQLVVLQLPFASVLQGQPGIGVVVTCKLSELADTEGSPQLTVKVRGGFQFGNDSANNPTVDPSLFEVAPRDFVVTPTVLTLTQTINVPEGETATGPNYGRTLTVTATPAPGQTLTTALIEQKLPDSIRVTGITPGAGGAIEAIVLTDGSYISDPAQIADVLATAPYLKQYYLRYDSLSAPVTSTVSFFVADFADTLANPLPPVLDPDSGDAVTITVAKPSALGLWLPLDPRDQQQTGLPPPNDVRPVAIRANGSDATFIARSLALHKTAAIAVNLGSAGLSPGDELQYTLELSISDYFAYGQSLRGGGNLTIVDVAGDGQTLVAGSPRMTVYYRGQTFVIPLVVSTVPMPDGRTTLTFDLAQSIANTSAILGGQLVGDLAFDGFQDGATRAVITYRTTVAQAYTTVYPQSEINEGDAIGNDATASGTILLNPVTLTGGSETDTSSASLTVPTNQVAVAIMTVNGGTPPVDGELRPGDIVTFRLSYDLTTGDYENFALRAYLPLPLFDLSGITWSQGGGSGQWTYGAGNTNSDPSAVDAVSTDAGNAILFDFGDYAIPALAGSRIEVQFTLTVGNQPFADQRSLTLLGQSTQLTTIPVQQQLVSQGVAVIKSIAEPALEVRHGVVAIAAGGIGTVTGTTGSWAAAGTAGPSFSGSITDLSAIDGAVTGIDGGDLVRLATALENTGGLGAFDVTTTVTLPADFAFLNGSLALANLQVRRGDGTLLVAGTDYSVSGNEITFLDPGIPNQPSLLPGRPGTPNDLSGANIVVITYDVVAAAGVAAARTLQTTAALTNYASTNGGPDFNPVDRTDTADQQVASPLVAKGYAGGTLSDDDSSATHTTGSKLVIGEAMLFDIVVTLPEGSTQSLRVTDLVPAGFRVDTTFNGNAGYQLLTTVAQSGALGADFAGTVSAGTLTAPGGDGVDLTLALATASANADNDTTNNAFVVRVRLVAGNVTVNQAGGVLVNRAEAAFTDPDGDTPNGSTPVDRTLALTGSAPTATIVEPTLKITQAAATNGLRPPGQVDAGDTVTYTISISNGSATSDFNAFDLSFLDNLPVELDSLAIDSVTYAGGATANGGPDFTLTGRTLATAANANIDVPTGGTITIKVSGVVNASAANVADFTNTAAVEWTSLDGTSSVAQPDERTGADGLLNSGVLNDYRQQSNLKLLVVSGATMTHVGGLPDTPAPSPDTTAPQTVAVGEIIRYRAAFALAEGMTDGATVRVSLPEGLSFVNDGTASIAFVSNAGIGYAGLTTGSANQIGQITDLTQTYLLADISNTATAALELAVINTGNPRQINFSLGNLVNSDFDPDREFVYIDFNARVDNTTAVDTSKSFSTSARFYSGGGATQIDKTQAVVENIVEPELRDLDKTVTDFDPNTAGTSGTATVTLSFSNTGDAKAYDVRLADGMSGGSNYVLQKVVIDGTDYLPGSLPAGVTVTTGGGITADFATVAVNAKIRLVYTVDVANDVIHNSADATLSWTSLPETFASFAGTAVGPDGAASGERVGSDGPPGPANPPNNYIVREGAGLGIVTGILWDDTASPTSSATPDGPGMAGITVTLRWAGADGILGSGDDRLFTTVTATDGSYRFGVLPAGQQYQITAPNPVLAHDFAGDVDAADVRVDTSGAPLGEVTIGGFGEAATGTADFGYVRENDAPVVTVPGTLTIFEDNQATPGQPPGPPVAVSGISIDDIDAGNGTVQVTVTAAHGRLDITALSGSSVSGGALNSKVFILEGTLAQLNAALATLTYMPDRDFNGNDTLTVVANDRGQLGDANGNLMPGENPGDALTDTGTIDIVITPVNDFPQGVDDVVDALEAGGRFNDVPGFPGSDNILANDIDPDIDTNNDRLRVTSITFGGTTFNLDPAPSINPVLIDGDYGRLVVFPNGRVRYNIDNADPAVEALRTTANTLSETFTYTLAHRDGATSGATITVTIQGANDAPVGSDDTGIAVEAGGVSNGTPGSDATGNVLPNDTDVDAFGETRAVTGIRAGPETVVGGGTMDGVAPGTDSGNGTVVAGLYGTLTIGADGSYRYVVDNANADVERLAASDTLLETFSYLVSDKEGLTDIAELVITIDGANDNPVASDDIATGQAQSIVGGTISGGTVVGGTEQGLEVNPVGNVITTASRPIGIPSPGNGIDSDVDRTDNPNTLLRVTAVRTGAESGSGTAGTVGSTLAGAYGSLTLNADGSFSYDVDSRNADVWQLPAGATLTDTFTYTLTDTAGLNDQAQIIITVVGVNDPPVASDVFPIAVEAGGIANGTPGTDPTGDVTANDFDPDGDPLSVTAIRTGPASGTGTAGTVGNGLAGTYGTLTVNADGTFSYAVDNANPLVEALRIGGQTLTDTFTYTVSDNQGESDTAEIVVTIRGANDNPVGVNDAATAVEAGGIANGIAGTDPTGNVLVNDTDVDSVANGETRTVTAIRTGSEAGVGTAGMLGIGLAGTYGTLTMIADGTYQYVVDNANPLVEALRTSGQTLADTFTYTVRDTAGATDLAQLTITIQGANDNPVARDDAGIAVEAGGVANTTPGSDATGNVLANDTDVDSIANGETATIAGFANSGGTAGMVGGVLAGTYGTLTLNADGGFTYVVDNANAVVQGLRTAANTLADTFTYTMRDTAGATAGATLIITIRGANDNPVAVDDAGTAVEAGGVNNGTSGSDATGDVLFNDTDVDNVAYGETRTVTAIRTGSEAGAGTAGVVGSGLAGAYGTLTVNADGTYTYVIDNDNAAVQALRLLANTLTDTFTYTMRDTAGATDTAQLTITLRGANDNPVATNDRNFAFPPTLSPPPAIPGLNPVGNVLTGLGIPLLFQPPDTDVDAYGEALSVSAVRTGAEGGSGIAGTLGSPLLGQYGNLILNADGSYQYVVDFGLTAGLGPSDRVVDVFTYTTRDALGLTDTAQLTITVRGRNDPPIALPVRVTAIEAGGVANGTPGLDPAGDALANDVDFDGDSLSVVAIRTGSELGSGVPGTVGTGLAGAYGTITVNADGTFTYVVDNANPLVEALRTSGDTLVDEFTYTVSDIYGASDTATISVTITGANDNPVAADDAGTAVEAGGIANATPGADATGDVLGNDTDVDLYGETKAVATVAGGAVGGRTAGRYGTLTLNADGSYTYVVDNGNPVVEALRTPAETLSEQFVYTVSDALGATATATLSITIRGANDNPVARDDTGLATDAGTAPVTSGNVLPNDSDVDGGDTRTVIGVRTGHESGTGNAGMVGTALLGRYGTLVLNPDGSWTYTIDTTNPDVANAAGAGRILSDVFTYTMRDTAGATDQAQLVVTLDMTAPYQEPSSGPFWGRERQDVGALTPLPDVEPVVFVERMVDAIQRQLAVSNLRNDGTFVRLGLQRQAEAAALVDDGSDVRRRLIPEIEAQSIGRGLARVNGQFVGRTVLDLATEARIDDMRVRFRHDATSLAADGLLDDPSWQAPDPQRMFSEVPETSAVIIRPPAGLTAAPSFAEQLRHAAQRLHPVAVHSAAGSDSNQAS